MKTWPWNLIVRYLRLRIQRKQLLEMDEHMRKDLALSRVDVEQLAGRWTVREDFRI